MFKNYFANPNANKTSFEHLRNQNKYHKGVRACDRFNHLYTMTTRFAGSRRTTCKMFHGCYFSSWISKLAHLIASNPIRTQPSFLHDMLHLIFSNERVSLVCVVNVKKYGVTVKRASVFKPHGIQ